MELLCEDEENIPSGAQDVSTENATHLIAFDNHMDDNSISINVTRNFTSKKLMGNLDLDSNYLNYISFYILCRFDLGLLILLLYNSVSMMGLSSSVGS